MRRMFSKKQIEEMLPEALEGKDLKVKTIEAEEPNKEFSISVNNIRGYTYTQRYCKSLVLSKILFIIMSFVLTNETEETITAGTTSYDLEVDDETAEHIICVDGEKLSDPYTSNKIISSMIFTRGDGLDAMGSDAITKVAKNKIRINFYAPARNAGQSWQVVGRTFLSLF